MRMKPHAADHAAHTDKPAAKAPHEHARQTGRGGAPAPAMSHDMAQEMGHGAGMDMQAMVRDMRNRFWISLVFTIPIFLFAPMGFDFIRLKPPFGLDLN